MAVDTTAVQGRTTAAQGKPTFVQVSIALQTLAIFFQAATAGLLLSSPDLEIVHGVGARVMYGATMLYVIAAILAWKPGGGSPRPIAYASGFLVMASLQVVLGIAHMPTLHVPLGVTMFGLSVLDLGRVLSARMAQGSGARA
ncbi:hypothetical protein ACWGDE_24525 [Streptomyces sp. NPDC054956]